MHRCGFIQHSSILPLVGGDPFAHPDATSCKIVTCCEGKLYIIVVFCHYCAISIVKCVCVCVCVLLLLFVFNFYLRKYILHFFADF